MSSSEGMEFVIDPRYQQLIDIGPSLMERYPANPAPPAKPRPAHAKRPKPWKMKIYGIHDPWPYYEPKGDGFQVKSRKHSRRAMRISIQRKPLRTHAERLQLLQYAKAFIKRHDRAIRGEEPVPLRQIQQMLRDSAAQAFRAVALDEEVVPLRELRPISPRPGGWRNYGR